MPGERLSLEMLLDRLRALLPAYRGARRLARELVTLPTHRFVTPASLDQVVELIAGVEG